MDYIKKLTDNAHENGSIVCFGLDPVIEKIPVNKPNTRDKIVKFYKDILVGFESEPIGTVKPNYAFFAQYGFEGLKALKEIIEFANSKNYITILDSKRADIGDTSVAYAEESFNFWKADAVTVNPYMGSDSVFPFIEECSVGKGVYVLVRTSNEGAEDFQDLKVKHGKLYETVAKKLTEWYEPGLGGVVGATAPKELKQIYDILYDSKKQIPLLIPGVGKQGGSAKEVSHIIRKNMAIHRINSSSGISYAYKKDDSSDYVGSAIKALEKLNKEINYQD